MYRTILVFLLLTLTSAIYANAEESLLSLGSRPPNLIVFEVNSGNISANLKDVPARIVMDDLRRQIDILYSTAEGLDEVLLTAKFEDVPLEHGLALILAPLNFAISRDDSTNRLIINLVGVKEGDRRVSSFSPPVSHAQAADSVSLAQASRPRVPTVHLPGNSMKSAIPLPSAVAPANKSSQPHNTGAVSQPLPTATQVSNDSGPVAPATGSYLELPSFTPVSNQTGPIAK
mgnify:CR=1 FL=1